MKIKHPRFLIGLWLLCQVLALSLLLPRPVYAHDCLTDPLNAADCMRTPGFRPAISIIISVGGTLATILVNLLTPTVVEGLVGDEAGEVPEDPVTYVLHLNQDVFELQAGKSDTLQLQGWKVRPGQGYGPADDMAIQVIAQNAPADFRITPTQGQGRLACTLTAPLTFTQDQATLLCTGSAGGKSVQQTVTVKLLPALVLTLTTPEGKTRLEPEKEGLWASARVTPEPPDPAFDPDEENPKISFTVEGPNADWVEIVRVEYHNQWQWVYLTAKAPAPGARLARGNPSLVAEYLEDKITLIERLTLELQTEYQLRVKPLDGKPPDITYSRGTAEWQAPPLLVYFVNPNGGDTPIDPGCNYGFPDPPVVIEPAALTLQSFEEHGPHQYLLHFQVDQDLAQYFGEDLIKQDGLVKLVVEVSDEDQEKHFAEAKYTVRPEAIPMLYFWKDSPNTRLESEREYSGLRLKPDEFLADGRDEVGIGAFLVRSDLADDFERAYDHPLGLRQPPQSVLKGINSRYYLLEAEAGQENPHRYAGRLKAKEVVLYESREHRLEVQMTVSLDTHRYPNYQQAGQSMQKIAVLPLEIYLKLWVLPGSQIGTSDAGAFLYVPTKKAPLTGTDLTLDILSGGATLTADQEVKPTDNLGLARWTLTYSGLTWKSYAQAAFTVRCGIPNPEGGYKGTQVRVDIQHNVHQLLADLQDQRNSSTLHLENPDFRTGSGFLAKVGDYCFPDFLSGPVVNISNFFTGKHGDYVCSELRDRINGWMRNRRFAMSDFDEKMLSSMNGIEIGQYSMWLLGPINHNFAGIFLSDYNVSPTYDPRFTDPWWWQDWSSPSRRIPDGLSTKVSEQTLQATTLMSTGVLFTLVCLLIGWAVGPLAVATLMPKLIPFFAGLSVTNMTRGVYINDPTLADGRYTATPDGIRKGRGVLLGKDIPPVEPKVSW